MSSAMIQTMFGFDRLTAGGEGVAAEAAEKERRRERERGRTVAKKAWGAFLWVIRCTQNLVTC